MQTFINQLAHFIANNYTDLSKLTVVLPARRAVKYIQKELFEVIQRPYFSPNFVTIEAFAKTFCEKQVVDSVELLFRFYEIYNKLGYQEDFESFMNWAPLFLSDCNDIDRQMVDPEKLFKNLREIREIEHWSFGEDRKLSESQQLFLEFWGNLKEFYKVLNNSLEEEGAIYSGKLMQEAALNVLEKVDECYSGHQFIFAGFNALSEAELQMMSALVNAGRAKVILEADSFYLMNTIHEAGLFIRRTKNRIPETIIFEADRLTNAPKEVEIISCAQSGSMFKVVQDLLAKMSREQLNDTLVLLADESLIVPAIKHIPKSVEQANITLGLPLKLTALRPWVELIFLFQHDFVYFKTHALYNKTLLAFLKHPFVQVLCSESDLEQIRLEEARIVKYNKIFTVLNLDNFSQDLKTLLLLALKPWKGNYLSALETFLSMNKLIFDKLDDKNNLLEKTAVYHFHQALSKLHEIFERAWLPTMTLRSFEKFFNLRWMQETIAYYGNPIDGVQVMGMLETRVLSFKNVIFVGVNEGVLPPNNSVNSLIPMDLRRYFNLPLPAEKDAIFAHHFYRLFAAAENIHMLHYSNSGNDFQLTEPSRYLQQIEMELGVNDQLRLTYKSFNLTVQEQLKSKGFNNTPEVQSKILDYFKHGLSASALNKFMNCPLDFYMRYVLKYSDDDEVEEEVEHSTFGTVIHQTLEYLYRPFSESAQPISPKDIESMFEQVDLLVTRFFKDKYESDVDHFESGEMYMALLAAKQQVRRFLTFERQQLLDHPQNELVILALEKSFRRTVKIKIDEKEEEIAIYGNIDRVDLWGGKLRILDYKTGNCTKKDVQFSREIFEWGRDLELEKLNKLAGKHVLQLMIYFFLYAGSEGKYPDSLGILSFQNLKEGLHELGLKTQKRSKSEKQMLALDQELIENIEKYIVVLAERVLTTAHFEHSSSAKFCNFCD